MFTSTDLKKIITEARPIIERQLDDALIVSGFRTTVTEAGGDWGQVKALLKAMIQDERDDAGGNKRVAALLEKADHATAYADMLGLGNLNENNYFETADRELIRGSVGREFPNDEPAGQTVEQGGEGGAALPADESSGNVDGSAGRSHSSIFLSTESPASVPLDTQSRPLDITDAGTTSPAGAEGDADRPPNPPGKKQWTYADRPHADCLDPGQCGGFSNLGLCPRCKEAAGRIAA